MHSAEIGRHYQSRAHRKQNTQGSLIKLHHVFICVLILKMPLLASFDVLSFHPSKTPVYHPCFFFLKSTFYQNFEIEKVEAKNRLLMWKNSSLPHRILVVYYFLPQNFLHCNGRHINNTLICSCSSDGSGRESESDAVGSCLPDRESAHSIL